VKSSRFFYERASSMHRHSGPPLGSSSVISVTVIHPKGGPFERSSSVKAEAAADSSFLDPMPIDGDNTDESDDDEEFTGQALATSAVAGVDKPSAASDIVVQRVEAPLSKDRVGTLRIMAHQPACVRLVLRCTREGRAAGEPSHKSAGVCVTSTLIVQPELWTGRQIGEWTAQEHQQLAVGLTIYGRDWARLQRLMVPSRSARELELYALRHLADRQPPPPLVPPPPQKLAFGGQSRLGRGGGIGGPFAFPSRPLRGPGSRGGRGSYGRRGSRGASVRGGGARGGGARGAAPARADSAAVQAPPQPPPPQPPQPPPQPQPQQWPQQATEGASIQPQQWQWAAPSQPLSQPPSSGASMDPNQETGQLGSLTWQSQLQLTPAPGPVLAPYPPPGDGGWCGCTGGASTVSCAGSVQPDRMQPDGMQSLMAVPQEDVDDEAAPPRAKAPATAPGGEDYEEDEEEGEVYDDEDDEDDEDEDDDEEDTAAAVGTKRVAKFEWDAEGVVLSAEGVVTGVGPGPVPKRPALA
jgi:uncharacterized membrane protein YgcG